MKGRTGAWGSILGGITGVFGAGIAYFLRIAPVGAAYKAKVLCSAIFVSGRKLKDLLAEDVSVDSYRLLRLFTAEVDQERKAVTVSWMGMRPRTAVFRPGLGSTLELGASGETLSPRSLEPGRRKPGSKKLPWPEGEAAGPLSPGIDAGKLERVVAEAFDEPTPKRLRRTRAVVVVKDGRIAAERYAPGFSPDMPMPGWSMTKSALSALVGILVGEGRLALDQRALLPEWSEPGDPRRGITLDHMLRMRSGLKFDETYTNPLSDVNRMLWISPDPAAYAAAKPLGSPPGQTWSYSSGTTNILSRIIRNTLGGSQEDYLRFPRKALFDPAGMNSALLEPGPAGDFVGSSFLFATARDWARFGLLYAQDGNWGGRRVLPRSWVAYSVRPTPESPNRRYGAHWWLKLQKELGGETEAARRLPDDAFHALGHEGQCLTVIPSEKLVVVRLGLSVYVDAWDHAAFLDSVLRALA